MTAPPSPEWSDEQIIAYIRHWAIERSKCGIDGYAANCINEGHVLPAGKILEQRGAQSVAKLLPLLDADNPDVRLTGASLAYEVDRAACRRMLEKLAKTLNMVGIMTWSLLSINEGPGAVPDPREVWGIKD